MGLNWIGPIEKSHENQPSCVIPFKGYQTSFIYEIGLVELPEVRLIPKDFNPPKGLFKASSTSLNK